MYSRDRSKGRTQRSVEASSVETWSRHAPEKGIPREATNLSYDVVLSRSALQVIMACVYGEHTTMRLKQLGMEFACWVFKHASQEQLKPMAPAVLEGLLRLLDEGNTLRPVFNNEL